MPVAHRWLCVWGIATVMETTMYACVRVRQLHNYPVYLTAMHRKIVVSRLSRVSTGSGFSTRELDTNDEEIIFDAKRPIIINGIGSVVEKSDLSDRKIAILLPRISENDRRCTTPISPKLMAILQDTFDDAKEGQERVVSLSRNQFLHHNMVAIVRRAEMEPWDDLFKTLRRSCETGWKLRFPAHAVHTWLGHSERVSENHYLMVPDHVWDEASGLSKSATEYAAVNTAPTRKVSQT